MLTYKELKAQRDKERKAAAKASFGTSSSPQISYQELKKRRQESKSKASGNTSIGGSTESSYSGNNLSGEYISSFFRDANDFLRQETRDYNALPKGYNGWRVNKTKYGLDSLLYRAKGKQIKDYLSSLDTDQSKELSSSVDNYLSAFDSLDSAYNSLSDYYGQWDSEDAYNDAAEMLSMSPRIESGKATPSEVSAYNNIENRAVDREIESEYGDNEGYKAFGNKWARWDELSNKTLLTDDEKSEVMDAMVEMERTYPTLHNEYCHFIQTEISV